MEEPITVIWGNPPYSVGLKSSNIIVNDRIAVRGIPAEAYDYVVNGKSAVEWVMERMAVSQDKKSLIVNDPNLWAAEHSDPRFIVRHLLRVVAMSCLSARCVAGIDGASPEADGGSNGATDE